ncbi:MAG TPA: lipoyl(octanoyl) transferase LipB [Burkholderiales bacterium]|nr:lipoyl(octanoyl) transferase LipB [Burkholderiales bacterium]
MGGRDATSAVAFGEALPSRIVDHPSLIIRLLGRVPYVQAYEDMRRFTATRNASTPDELWLLEHPPVYTVGQAGRLEHLLRETAIPVARVDRGGQITFHGPGQLIAYALLDLRRRSLTVRRLVATLEQAVIDFLAAYRIAGERRPGAPGVYVAGGKIAALGLRVRNGCCYHGLALNVAMDLAPFRDIDPCGYEGLAVTQLADLGVAVGVFDVAAPLAARVAAALRASGPKA